jgi:tripartite-type tricarboxylate transporter receptor subunit TctC
MFARADRVKLTAFLLVGIVILSVVAPERLRAQSFPDRPVRMIIPYAPSGGIDTLGRIVAEKLSQLWGQNVFVENRPGAGGDIGSSAAAKTAPDGYTLLMGGQFLASNVSILPMEGFDPARDFDPIILIATGQDVLTVPPDSPFHSFNDVLVHAKANPGELTYASLGVGASSHLAMLLLTQITDTKLQHVPYTTFNQAFADVSAGRIALWIATLSGALGHIQAHQLNALAVSGDQRAGQLPDVPTLKELGVPYNNDSWYALFAPKGTPRTIVDKINADTARVIADPDVKAKEAILGFRSVGSTPDQLEDFFRGEITRWAEVAKRADLARANDR